MQPEIFPVESLAEDSPIPLLFRRKVEGDRMLIAHIQLKRGCRVVPHRHSSEQMSYVVSGRVAWTFGEPGGEQVREEAGSGSIVRLPSDSWHGVDALEDTTIVDILSPPGKMGVDSAHSQ